MFMLTEGSIMNTTCSLLNGFGVAYQDALGFSSKCKLRNPLLEAPPSNQKYMTYGQNILKTESTMCLIMINDC